MHDLYFFFMHTTTLITPMENYFMILFCLNGYNGEKISMELNEVIGFPGNTSIEGGYDIICTLIIDSACYHIEYDRLYSATGALYRFSKELDSCYTNLFGSAKYHLLYENDLSIKVEMMTGGHAIVTGTFQDRPDKHNILQFEFDTDQSCLLSVIQDIESLKAQYGDMEGLQNK